MNHPCVRSRANGGCRSHDFPTANQKHWRDYFNTGAVNWCAPEYIKKASKIIEYVNLTKEEKNVISTLERLEANDHAQLVYHENKGKTEGRAEGIIEGRAIGKAEAEKKSYEEKLGVAKSLLGILDAEIIAEKFHIPLNEIAAEK